MEYFILHPHELNINTERDLRKEMFDSMKCCFLFDMVDLNLAERNK